MHSNEKIIRDFVSAWSNLNPEELASYFTEDGTYYNMPTQPVTGREKVQQFITGFIANWTKTEWELLSIAENGNVVIAERLDKTTAGDVYVELPCCGVFEMENGKIKVWRDYFDLATFTNAFT